MKKLSYASVVELIRFLRPVVWGFHIHLPTVGEYENLKLLAKILLVQHQMHKILIYPPFPQSCYRHLLAGSSIKVKNRKQAHSRSSSRDNEPWFGKSKLVGNCLSGGHTCFLCRDNQPCNSSLSCLDLCIDTQPGFGYQNKVYFPSNGIWKIHTNRW